MSNEIKISFALSFISGFVDTAGFMALFGLFTAHVTGNLVLAGAAFSGEHGNLIGKLLILPVFVASVMCSSYLIKYKKATVMVLMALFAVVGMAIQNTYMRKLLSSYTPNTVMTGNFTQFSIDIFNTTDHYFFKNHHRTPGEIKLVLSSLKKVTNVLTGFLSGCLLGALLVKMFGLICCLLPAILLLWVKMQLSVKNKLTKL